MGIGGATGDGEKKVVGRVLNVVWFLQLHGFLVVGIGNPGNVGRRVVGWI